MNNELHIRELSKNNADDSIFNLLKLFIKEQQNYTFLIGFLGLTAVPSRGESGPVPQPRV